MKDNINKALIVTEKICFNMPTLFGAIIQHDLVEEKEFDNISTFINEAIKEKLLRLGFNLEVTEIPGGWFDGTEKGGYVPTPIRNKVIPYKKRRRYFG